ncbi:glycosyltransferase family 39 protein [Patescibacteria group bacterium]|nr:glycosyltransferase family 39 protein [Patescibacteria group bacterium]
MKKEIREHKIIYLLLLLILIGAAFFRLYRSGDLLGFYYDQGRDALKVQEILAFKDFPAIGPTTGFAGLFLGPFWFYLLALFYWLGRGNPSLVANFISLFDVAAVFLIYWLGKEFFNRRVGLLAALFWGFSFYLVFSGRWLSNPSPVPFFTILLLYGLGKFFLQKKDKYLILISVCLAICLQLEMASAIFFIPSIALVWLIFRPKIKNKKNLFWTIGIFLAFLVPQALFEVKNKFLMTRNFFSFSRGGINTDTAKTWALPTLEFIKERIFTYFNIFFSKLETNPSYASKILVVLWLIFLLTILPKAIKRKSEENSMILILLIFLFVPLFFLLFFVGNYGQLSDYYLTGFFPAFILLFALFVAFFLKKKLFSGGTSYAYWPLFALIMFLFAYFNLPFLKNYLSAGVDGPTHITLGNQLQSVDWIYEDAKEEKFNVDVYVPPVIPYAYEYLFKWRGERVYHYQPVVENVPLLYTLYEVDLEHPFFLDAWLARQDKIADTISVQKYGGVSVERRLRKNK